MILSLGWILGKKNLRVDYKNSLFLHVHTNDAEPSFMSLYSQCKNICSKVQLRHGRAHSGLWCQPSVFKSQLCSLTLRTLVQSIKLPEPLFVYLLNGYDNSTYLVEVHLKDSIYGKCKRKESDWNDREREVQGPSCCNKSLQSWKWWSTFFFSFCPTARPFIVALHHPAPPTRHGIFLYREQTKSISWASWLRK